MPSGTVTFLFTDIEGSTPLWEQRPEQMAQALQIHNATLRQAIEANGGVVFKTVGDAFQAAFSTAPQALRAAIEGQKALQAAPWNELGMLKVRMGLHTGEAELDPNGDEYAVSHTKNRVARIMSAAWGGQILLSEETADLVKRRLPDAVKLKDLGEHQLKGMDILERLFQVCAPGLPQDFPPLTTTVSRPNNLPVQLTSFIGREIQVAQVKELVRQHALVTLTGSGGVGKTRLSLQVARELLDEFPDGVWLVELAPVTDPGLIVQAMAATLGLRTMTSQLLHEILLEYIRSRKMLLVLDNCEHLIEACAKLVDNLLQVGPKIRILASSREALGVLGEVPYRVPSLTLPDLGRLPEIAALEEYESVQLFTERARVIRPDFQLGSHNARTVSEICQRLDGIPLAIELAAARLGLLTSEQFLGHLQDAFRVLTGGARTVLPRQQTLRATIDWSYRLLSGAEKDLLQRLAVFSGTFDLEAVRAVCCLEAGKGLEMLDGLTSLAVKSILAVERHAEQGMRYRLLETVRQYAREKLNDSGESENMFDAHASYYLELARQGGSNTFTRYAPTWLRRVDVEFDNIRQAMNWALNGPALVRAVQALNTLGWYWLMRCSWDEGYTWTEQALRQLDFEHPTLERAGLLRELGMVSIVRPFSKNAREYLDESREIFRALGDWCGYAAATRWLAVVYYGVDWKLCFDYYLESAHIFRQLGDDLNLAISWWMLGHNLRDSGDLEQGEYYLGECERLFRELGSWMVGNSDFNLARIYDIKGQVPEARRLYAQALPLLQGVNDHWGIMWCKIFLGEMELKAAADRTGLLLARRLLLESLETSQKLGRAYVHNMGIPILLAKAESRLGEPAGAIHWYREALSIIREFYLDSNDWELVTCGKCLYGLAELFASQHQPLYSARLLGGLDGLREIKSRLWDEISADDFDRLAQAVRVIVGRGDFNREFAKGKGMTLEQAVELALTVSGEYGQKKP